MTASKKRSAVSWELTDGQVNLGKHDIVYGIVVLTPDPTALELVVPPGHRQAPVVIVGDPHRSRCRSEQITALTA